MFIKINSAEKRDVQVALVETVVNNADDNDQVNEAEIRRQMYERIARGNALAEVEENARHEWRWRR